MAKNSNVNEYTVGQNITASIDGEGWANIRINLNAVGAQTKASQEPGKVPNEMVASTKAYVSLPGTTARLLLHLIRPMTVQAVRTARAVRELESDEPSEREVMERAIAKLKPMSDEAFDAELARRAGRS